MKILLLNDTSDYHNGCRAVVSTFTYAASVKTDSFIDDLSTFTHVVLNGEGTMHHNKPNAVKFLHILRKAQRLKLYTSIVNTVWQDMSNDFDDVLANLNRIEVREQLSYEELLYKHRVTADIRPDRSILVDVPNQPQPFVKIYEGQYFFNYKPLGLFPRINIFQDSWDSIVNKLRNSNLLITNRHHEMYAAIKANCRFICLPSNSHKIEGIFKTVNENPITDYRMIPKVLAGDFDHVYDKIQKFCIAEY